ncbi:MAG TPA: SDR family oxidoreductase, partial [Candidatus Limnocylindria bacterium]|nr:SDR family oxidoreductase [Candidatus Limnocylindria bacterium]
GAIVIVIDRLKIGNKGLRNYFQSANVYFFSAEVNNANKISVLVKKIYKKFGRIDIVVNCAGLIGAIGEFHSNNFSDWTNTLSVNFLGTVNVCHAALPFLLKKKQGKIINFAGGGAVRPFPNFSAYASSKAAVVRFSENLAKEYQDFNIQVNAVAPGVITTKLVDDLLKAGKEKVGAFYFKKTLADKARGGDDPKQAADLVVFLCSTQNKLTGKLVSAKWDGWEQFSRKSVAKLNRTSEYTLRRIDNKYFYESR